MSVALLLSLPLLVGSSTPQSTATAPADRVEGWRVDLAYFAEEARRLHASPERPAHGPRFAEAVEALHRDVPELTDDQMLCRFMALAAVLNDGHTAIYGPSPDTPLHVDARVLPFKFYAFPEGLHIVDGDGDWADYAGSRVLRIGELEAAEVLRRLRVYRGVDNEQTWSWLLPAFYLKRLALLRDVGAAGAGDEVDLEVETLDGERVTLSVPCGEHELPRKLRPFPLGVGDPPLWLSRVDTNFWIHPFPEERALYAQFNQVRDAPGESLERFAGRLRARLLEEDARTLILDVRHNNGGNNTLLRPLLRTMIEFELRSPEHRIYVLMGRNTFSAAQNFLNHTERWTNATFVGEPSASSPNFTGEENELVLPWSRLRGSLSIWHWQDAFPWDRRPWIEPDIAVELPAVAYFEGYDPVLERVLAELRG